jgi:hypothetical protein
VLTREQFEELTTLKRTLDAQIREQDRRQAAIDRDGDARDLIGDAMSALST